jgi:ComF family protein
MAEPLAQLLHQWWADHSLHVDVVIPVPLHPARERERGYNQAALLSSLFSQLAGLAEDPLALERVRYTRPQVDLNAVERKANVAGAFRCHGTSVASRRVLLIDDVCTTGSTLEAAAHALRLGNARNVSALTVGRAPSGDYQT